MVSSKTLTILVVSCVVIAGAGIGLFIFLNDNDNDDGTKFVDTLRGLQVYGNADGDGNIDNDDIAYLERIISGEITEVPKYADANKDGVVSQADIIQVRKIIDDTADFIWLTDGDGHDIKVKRNPSRIGCEYYANIELALILGLKNKVAAIDYAPYQFKDFYMGAGSNVLNMGNMNSPNYENLLTMNLDTILTFSYSGTESKRDHLVNAGVDVIYLGMYRPDLGVEDPLDSEYYQAILKAGYIFGNAALARGEAYLEWLMGIKDMVLTKTAGIAEADRPKVLMTNYSNNTYFISDNINYGWSLYTSIDPLGQACLAAGGYSVARDILTPEQYSGGPARTMYGVSGVTPESIISAGNIDYTFCHSVKYTYAGSEVATTPAHGYTINDPSAMNAAQALAASRTQIGNVHDSEIYVIAGDFRNGASGCMLLLVYMAKILHPDLFADLDPLSYHQQYVTQWMGIQNYDIHNQGVFISPMPSSW